MGETPKESAPVAWAILKGDEMVSPHIRNDGARAVLDALRRVSQTPHEYRVAPLFLEDRVASDAVSGVTDDETVDCGGCRFGGCHGACADSTLPEDAIKRGRAAYDQFEVSPSVSPSAAIYFPACRARDLRAYVDSLRTALARSSSASSEPVSRETDPWFVLDACERAIEDAIGLEDGLDGAAGESVIAMIRNARDAHGRPQQPSIFASNEDDGASASEPVSGSTTSGRPSRSELRRLAVMRGEPLPDLTGYNPSASEPMTRTVSVLNAGDNLVWCRDCKRWVWNEGDSEAGCSHDTLQQDISLISPPTLAEAQEAIDALYRMWRDADDVAAHAGDEENYDAESIRLRDWRAGRKFPSEIRAELFR